MGFSENTTGLVLAIVSSLFIGTSFILKKKGLKRAAAAGTPAGVGGYTYLREPLWWAGMITMIVGEVSNFVAYIYAPAVLVTPLGALSIIIRIRGNCYTCTSGAYANFCTRNLDFGNSTRSGLLVFFPVYLAVDYHVSPRAELITNFSSLLSSAAFVIYVAATISIVVALMLHFEPRYGQTNVLVYLGICSLMGALTVVSIKAIGIAIKLTLEGISQIAYPQTWFFLAVAVICVVMQLNYLNKALDTFNAAIVSPVYYVMFTTLTIIASAIMFKDWAGQNASSIVSEMCGFITVLSGTIVLHVTREQEPANPPDSRSRLQKLKLHPQLTVYFLFCFVAEHSCLSSATLSFVFSYEHNFGNATSQGHLVAEAWYGSLLSCCAN
ncbi:putative magnesium transporter NIPA6 [Capsicum annuum]|nr:putative magnesium transporter NIPA6 [Capsicum annuum]